MSAPAPSRLLALAAAFLVFPLAEIAAQEKPTEAAMSAMAGTWKFNVERSDPLADNPMAVEAMRPRPADAVGGAPSGGGGGRRGGGGGGGGGAPAGGGMAGRMGGGGAMLRNPYVRELVTQLQPPGVLVIGLTETTAALGATEGEPVSWTTDGKKRQKAQMDGTLLEFAGKWRGTKLTLIDAVSGTAELKRELHVIDDGDALEMKLELSGPGFPRKLERKVVYTRN